MHINIYDTLKNFYSIYAARLAPLLTSIICVSMTMERNHHQASQLSVLLVLITLAQFIIAANSTIVQVALPSIGREFGVSVNGLQWIITAYGLTSAGFLMLSGRVGDIYGRKKLFIIGVLLFSLASLAGGLAPSEIVLILARVVQGLGPAMASATGLSILVAAFPEGMARNRALSVFAAASGSGFAVAMILGGVITTTLEWRWVFDINVPIGVAVSLLSIKYISRSTTRRTGSHESLDILGGVSITAGLMLLVYSLSSAQDIGIGSPQTLELLLLSGIVLAAFLLIEYGSKGPLMPLGFLRSSIFGANAVGLIQIAAFVAMIFILTNYFQQVLGYSALSAGIAFAPMGVVFLVVSGFLSARFVNRFGLKPIIISGMVLQTIAYLLLSPISLTDSYFGGLLGPMLLIGVGFGLGYTAINIAALTGRLHFRINQYFTSNWGPNRSSSTLDSCEF